MTNKIYLSFNSLYRLQDGDYHAAKLSFKIKHGDKVIAEGEHVGKTLSKFISPITIEETEITQQLTVEYVSTGNVEDVSVYQGATISAVTDAIRVKDSNGQTRCVVGPINIEPKLETTDTQKKLDELQKTIEGSKEFATDMIIGINKNFDAIISNALATQAEAKAEREQIKKALADSVRQAVNDAVKAAQKDFETRGPLRRTLRI